MLLVTSLFQLIFCLFGLSESGKPSKTLAIVNKAKISYSSRA